MLEILLIFILPVVVIVFSPFFYKHRQFIFIPTALIAFYLIWKEHLSLFNLGFRFDNFYVSIIPYLSLTILGSFLIILIAKVKGHTHLKKWWKHSHFQVGFILLSFLQEFLYRGYLLNKLSTLFTFVPAVILSNSLIFAFIHIIYPHKIRNFTLSFFGGLAFATIFYYLPNIYLITITHSVFNFFALLYGLIGPNDFRDKNIIG